MASQRSPRRKSFLTESIKHCQEEKNGSRVKIHSDGKTVIFLNDEAKTFIITRADGCVIQTGKAADFVVSQENKCDIIIELKGRDIDTALKQVKTTADYWKSNNLFVSSRVSALIVANCCRPCFNPTIQRAKNEFSSKHKGPLHVVVRSRGEFQVEAVLSFKGPHRT